MEIAQTERRFDLIRFTDRCGQKCKLQKSSNTTEDSIWLGVLEDAMHLTRQQVKELLPFLQNFVDRGELL